MRRVSIDSHDAFDYNGGMRAIFLALSFSSLLACETFLPARSDTPQGALEEKCVSTCRKQISSCDQNSCIKGCRIALDRIVEHEQDTVFACVARSKTCSDYDFARCSARVGVHADGGPPLPEKPKSEDD